MLVQAPGDQLIVAPLPNTEHDVPWILLCSYLVVSMQLGFALLEIGSCRDMHRNTILLKNLLDTALSSILFWLHCSVYSPSFVAEHGVAQSHLLIFHWSFCSTAVTICSGAMAERTHVTAYLWYVCIMAGWIYPNVVEGAWGTSETWLSAGFHCVLHDGYKFHDFAGSGVVHLAGGVMSFVGVAMAGRRIVKPKPKRQSHGPSKGYVHGQVPDMLSDLRDLEIPENPKPDETIEIHTQSDDAFLTKGVMYTCLRRFDDADRDAEEFHSVQYFQIMGMFTLWVGWYGFNTGSALTTSRDGTHATGLTAFNTTLAAGGAAAGVALFEGIFRFQADLGNIVNGTIAGLVAITASCDVATPAASIVIGLIAGFIVFPCASRLMIRLRLDDPVNAVAVHAGGGLLGLLAVSFCKPNCGDLATMNLGMNEQLRFCAPEFSIWLQFVAQLQGAAVIISWTAVWGLLLLGLLALSEMTRACEGRHTEAAKTLVAEVLAGNYRPDVVEQLVSVTRRSPICRRIFGQNGLTLDDGSFFVTPEHDLKRVNHELCQVYQEIASSLELSHRCCPLEHVARVMYDVPPLRALAVLRLRITPAAEISGSGMLDGQSRALFAALKKAVLFLDSEWRSSAPAQKSTHALEQRIQALQQSSVALQVQVQRLHAESTELKRLVGADLARDARAHMKKVYAPLVKLPVVEESMRGPELPNEDEANASGSADGRTA